MNWRGFIVIAVVAAAVVVLVFFIRRHGPAELPLSIKPEAPQPGYYMLDANIIQTGADGLPLYRISAQRIQQNPNEQSFQLEGLELIYSIDDARHWTLTATNGFVPPDSKTLDLRDNVQIVGQPEPGGQPVIVRTRRLLVDTKTSRVSTRERVDFEWGSARLSTNGLKGDLKARRLRLESGVRGQLVP